MKLITGIASLLILSMTSIAQKRANQIEIIPYLRWDKYSQFTYSINTISTNTAKIQGSSWGINAAYKTPLKKSIYAKVGLGYYRYSFNKIENINSLFGKGNSRVIKFPSPVDKVYVTDKYWYNTISINIGIEKMAAIKNNLSIIGGFNLTNFLTFSQYYHITNAPTDIQSQNYKLSNKHYFGLSANIHAALVRKIGNLNIGPSIILPIYDLWKQDVIFPQETNSKKRNKWLRGFGIGVTIVFH